MLHDSEGRLRTRVTFALIVALVFLIGFTTLMVVLVGTAVDPAVLAVGAVAILIFIKVPLLVVVWRLMGRHLERPGDVTWDREERQEILAYLEREAAESVGKPDARARLDYLTREAWNVADRSPDDEKAPAVATALRIRAMTPVGSPTEHPPA